MNIIGLEKCQNARWKNIPCSCDHSSVLTEFPIMDCLHCKCEKQENSIPKNDFVTNVYNQETNQNEQKTITEIKLVFGEKYEEVIGWTYTWQ